MTDLPDVLDLIPQRGRWRIISRLVSLDLSTHTLTAEADFDEVFTEGHFPGQPVVPGVALLEGLAQTMLCLSRLALPEQEGTPFLVGFDKVRFRSPVLPPATVQLTVKADFERAGLHTASGTVRWNGQRAATARLIGTVAALPAPPE